MKNLPDIGFNYYFFGSSDSLDIDVLIDHPDSKGREEDDKIYGSDVVQDKCTINKNKYTKTNDCL